MLSENQGQQFYAMAPHGLEDITAQELRTLGADDVRPAYGGVYFRGDQALLYKANLWLRSASRILMPLRKFRVHNPDELYRHVNRIDWDQYLTPDKTFSVDCTLAQARLTHSRFAALKTKDAIVDQLRRVFDGKRPNVDTKQPDIRVNVFIHEDTCILSLDSTAESLHRRGYRDEQGPAPLKENLAAALLLAAEYDGTRDFYDPMCGSGTLAIEAALIACHKAPSINRKYFGFFGWPDFDPDLWEQIRQEALAQERPCTVSIAASDQDFQMVRLAQYHAKNAQVGSLITFSQKSLEALEPQPHTAGLVVLNPPYGERLDETQSSQYEVEALKNLYKTIGDKFKKCFSGWTGFVLTGNLDLAKSIGLKPSQRITVYNGPIECRFLKFELYEGSKKQKALS